MVSLDFIEDDATWVTSNISGAAVVLGEEAIDIMNWIICFGFKGHCCQYG